MGKRFCESCGNELKEDSLFCTVCGAKVKTKKENVEKNNESKNKKEATKNAEVEVVTEKNTTVNPNNNMMPPKKGHKGLIIVLVLIFVLLVAGVLLWYFVLRGDNSKDNKKEDDEEVVEKEDEKEEEEDEEEEKLPEVPFSGLLYELNDGYGWATDYKYYYLINQKGKLVSKIDYVYSGNKIEFIDGYSQIGDSIYDTTGKVVLTKADKFENIDYVGKGLAIVKVVEENYKGRTEKIGIYDIVKKEYNYDLVDDIYQIFYKQEGMFLIRKKVDVGGNSYIYNSETKKSFEVEDSYDVILDYRDGYIAYRSTNSDQVYLYDKNGTKKLAYDGERHVSVGQYSDGLIYIKDAFYDVNGKKVIDLKDEGVSNLPEFINGYALVYFNTGYFTILSKETGEYMFTPRSYIKMGMYYNDDFTLGIYQEQNQISKTGHILVKVPDDGKHWAVMDVNGKIVANFPVGAYMNTGITDSGYIGLSGNGKNYYMTVKGKTIDLYIEQQ